MKSCVEAICADSTTSLDEIYKTIGEKSKSSNALYDKEITPLVEAIVKVKTDTNLSTISKLLEWLKKPTTLKNPGQIRIFNLFYHLKNLRKFSFKAKDNDPSTVEVDREKSKPKFQELNDSDFEKTALIGSQLMKIIGQSIFMEYDPSRLTLNYGDQLKAFLTQKIDSFSEKLKKIQEDPDLSFLSQSQFFKESVSYEKIKYQLLNASVINSAFLEALSNIEFTLNVILASSDEQQLKKFLLADEIETQKFIDAQKSEELLKEREKRLKSMMTLNHPVTSPSCRNVFEQGQIILPSQQEFHSFQLRISRLKLSFLDRTQTLACEASSKSYADEVSSWTPGFPYTKEQHLENLKAALQYELSEMKNQNSLRKEVLFDLDVENAITALFIPTEPVPENLGQEVDCDSLSVNPLPDATFSSINRYAVGPMTVKDMEAKSVLFHEWGHKLSKFLQNQKSCSDPSRLGKAQQCLHSMHTELPAGISMSQLADILISGDISKLGTRISFENRKYVDEDWADLIATHVDPAAKNFWCMTSKKTADADYAKLSLKNEDEGDTHSSSLFRLLHTHFIKNGSIPVQCEKALAARGEKPAFKNCLAE